VTFRRFSFVEVILSFTIVSFSARLNYANFWCYLNKHIFQMIILNDIVIRTIFKSSFHISEENRLVFVSCEFIGVIRVGVGNGFFVVSIWRSARFLICSTSSTTQTLNLPIESRLTLHKHYQRKRFREAFCLLPFQFFGFERRWESGKNIC
jgi:hypothetical protein